MNEKCINIHCFPFDQKEVCDLINRDRKMIYSFCFCLLKCMIYTMKSHSNGMSTCSYIIFCYLHYVYSRTRIYVNMITTAILFYLYGKK